MGPSVGSTAQLTIQTVACSGEKIINAVCKHRRESKMDRGLRREGNRGGKTASSRCRDSDDARAE
jgi:hypothetical protein